MKSPSKMGVKSLNTANGYGPHTTGSWRMSARRVQQIAYRELGVSNRLQLEL